MENAIIIIDNTFFCFVLFNTKSNKMNKMAIGKANRNPNRKRTLIIDFILISLEKS